MADSSTQPFTQPSQPTLEESGFFDDQQSVYGILVPANGDLNPVSLKNTKSEYTFGRDDTNDIQLPSTDVISGTHFKILLINQGLDPESSVVMLEDCSTNGTFVNQKKVGKFNKKLLQHGDEISFGIARGMPKISYIYRSAVHFALSQEEESDGIHAKYDFGHALGTGAFATVRQVVDKSTGKIRACKVMDKHKLAMTAMSAKMVQREVEILSQLQHAHIVGYVDYFEDDETIYIVMELASGGDMYKYISKQQGLQESEAKRLMRQIFEAIKYTHSLSITHRDLKPENILLTGDDPPNAKVTDFGLAKAVDDQTFLKTICGTPNFLAPEIIAHGQHRQGYSQAVDAWSLGVIVYGALANIYPFTSGGDGQGLMQSITAGTLNWEPLQRRNCSQLSQDFIKRLLTVDPAQRMTITQALEHPWLSEGRATNSQTDNPSALTRENTGTTAIEANFATDPSPSEPLFSMEMDDPFAAPARKRQRSQSLSDSNSASTANLTNGNGHEASSVQANGVPMDIDGSSLEQVSANPDHPQDFWAVLLPKANSSVKTNFGIVESPTQTFPLTIGRTEPNLIILADKRISKRHCSLYVVDGKTCIKDVSTYGIYVNDSKLGKNRARTLEDCDEIALFQDEDNGTTITYVFRPWKDLPPAERLLSFKSINIPSDSGSKRRKTESSSPWARLNSINPAVDSVVLREKYVVLGRDQTTCCHSFTESRLSKNHCSIVRDGPTAYITDLSRNGTYHNGNKLRRGKRCVIRSGDEVVLVHADEHDTADVHRQLLAAGSVDTSRQGVIIGFVFTIL